MAEGIAVRAVADALNDVAQWKTNEEGRLNAELTEVDREITAVQTSIENLKQQLETFAAFRGELMGNLASAQDAVAGRTYEAIFGTLTGQLDQLGERAAALAAREATRDEALLKTLDDPETKTLLGEYQQFKMTVAPTLANLPPTYRSAMERLHSDQREQIAQRLAGLGTAPIASDGPDLAIDIILAVDAPEAEAELVMLVLPISEEVYSRWSDRQEDLQTRLAARALQGAYSALASLGMPGAHGIFGGHRNLLAIEIEIAATTKEAATAALSAKIQAALDAAPELLAAKVKANVQVVDADSLLPPEPPAEVEVSND